MSKTLKAAIVTLSVAIVLFVVAGGLLVRASSNEGAYRQLGVYSEVLSRIRSEYVEEPNFPAVTDGALHGLLEALDPNSSYLSPAEYKQYKQRKTTGKAGVGAALSKRFGYAAVISVLPHGPAEKAGIESGDIIEAVEGRSTRDMSLEEIRGLMVGEPGSNITFSVVRARRAEPQKVTVTRELISVPPVSQRLLEDGIGYIKPETLSRGKAQELGQRIKAMQEAGARKLILDLRNAAEGEPAEGIAVANLFLNHGTIAYLQGQKYPRETYTADPQKMVSTLPLVVLVNRGTAGAAEIVAAAVLENARGDVLGDRTFGNGSVQKVIEIADGSALILSVAKYYTPNGKVIQDNPITPNILVAAEEDSGLPDEEEETAPRPGVKPTLGGREDEQLRRAIELLKNRPS